MWIVRDKKNNRLCLFLVKPIKSTTGYLGFGIISSKNIWKVTNPSGFVGYINDCEIFKNLSFDDEPIEVELNLKTPVVNVQNVDINNIILQNNNRLKRYIKHLKQKISKLCNPNNSEFIDVNKLIMDNDEFKKKNKQLTKQVKHLKQKITKLCNPNNKSFKNN